MIEKQNDFIVDAIAEIEYLGKQQTYDFTIPKTHCFFANGILVHNTLEEHSDSVILLYWTKRNEPAHDNPNDYEVNIAKQRHGATMKIELSFEPQFYRITDRKFGQRTVDVTEKSYMNDTSGY